MHALLMVMFLFSTMACAQEEVATKPILTLEGAKKIMVAAEASANKNKAKVVIAIVDDGGTLIALHRLNGTQVASKRDTIIGPQTAKPGKRGTYDAGTTGNYAS